MKNLYQIDEFLDKSEIDNLESIFKEVPWKLVTDRDDGYGRFKTLGLARHLDRVEIMPFEQYLLDLIRNFTLETDEIPSNILPHTIYYNAIRYGDKFKWHTDGTGPTFLIYGNKRWNRFWKGHTIFKGRGKVLPAPGRMIVFPGNTPHKASAPSRFFKEDARFSFVVQTNLV